MKARSKRFGSITAFSGREFVRYEWRDVPAGFEDEARRNSLLELTDDTVNPAPDLEPLSLVEVEPVNKPTKHRKGAK